MVRVRVGDARGALAVTPAATPAVTPAGRDPGRDPGCDPGRVRMSEV